MQFNIIRHASVTSTMDACRELAEHDAPEGTVVVADEQTKGRGRAGHTWYSPAGQALYVSILLRPDLLPHHGGWLTMLSALAVLESVKSQVQSATSSLAARSLHFSLRWFNDVHLNGRKVAGVLVESALMESRLDYAIVGIGLNVNTRFDGAPAEVQARAISLRDVLGRDLIREHVLASLLESFGRRYDGLMRHHRSPASEYASHLETLGQRVTVQAGEARIEGVAMRVQDDGALIVQTEAGERAIAWGELV
jgi:BirA family biotin operon repressor/biotin-[acetyl-CoA-carboxylase] ligase